MRTIIIAAIIAVSLFGADLAHAFPSKGDDCSKCHTLKKEEAQTLLREIMPNTKLIEIRMSPTRSAWEISVETTNNKKGVVYLDFTKKFLFLGTLVDIKNKKNLTEDRVSEITKVNVAMIPLDDALVLGNRNARHRVIVFDDPECPYCGKLHQEIKQVIKQRPDIAFFVKMFPLKIHPKSYEKAKAIVCEKSVTLLEDSFAGKSLPKAKCATKVVDETLKLGEKLGIDSTPVMVLPNGRLVNGHKNAKYIEELLKK